MHGPPDGAAAATQNVLGMTLLPLRALCCPHKAAEMVQGQQSDCGPGLAGFAGQLTGALGSARG